MVNDKGVPRNSQGTSALSEGRRTCGAPRMSMGRLTNQGRHLLMNHHYRGVIANRRCVVATGEGLLLLPVPLEGDGCCPEAEGRRWYFEPSGSKGQGMPEMP